MGGAEEVDLEERLLAALDVLLDANAFNEEILASKFAGKYSKEPYKWGNFKDLRKDIIRYFGIFEGIGLLKKQPLTPKAGASGHIDTIYKLLAKAPVAKERISEYIKSKPSKDL